MDKPLRTVLCGIGGYGGWYTCRFLDRPHSPIAFVGFADPFRKTVQGGQGRKKSRAPDLPVYDSLEAFYARHDADLAIVASPIQCHAPQTVCALEHGSHVLVEKPLCATIQEAHRMRDARDRAGRIVAVGYQDSFAEETHSLKRDIVDGVWGRPVRLKGLVHWPRNIEYYGRNAWAGRVRDACGHWILDSPVNNAVAHYLHYMLYALGDAPDRSAVPVEVQACLCRAHAIENYDTAFVRCQTEGGAEIFFVASHTGLDNRGPVFEFEFERGVVQRGRGGMRGVFNNGTSIDYGWNDWKLARRKVHGTVAAIREQRAPLCGIEAAMSHTLCMNGVQESGTPIGVVPPGRIRIVPRPDAKHPGKTNHWPVVDGLDAMLEHAFRTARLPDSSVADWLRPGPVVDLGKYKTFPQEQPS